MSNALKGVLILIAVSHFMLIIIPVLNTIYASISIKSKAFWCAFLIFLPLLELVFFTFDTEIVCSKMKVMIENVTLSGWKNKSIHNTARIINITNNLSSRVRI